MFNDKEKKAKPQSKTVKKVANGKKTPIAAETPLGKFGREVRKMAKD